MAKARGGRQSTRMRRRYTKELQTQLLKLVDGNVAVPEAAATLGVASSTAYNWLAKRRELGTPSAARVAAPTFVRLLPSAAAAATIGIRVGGAKIEVRQGFDGELLRAVVATLLEGAR